MRELSTSDEPAFCPSSKFIAKQRIEQIKVRELTLGGTLQMLIKSFTCAGELQRFELAAYAMEYELTHTAAASS
jgi:hypothetical protein